MTKPLPFFGVTAALFVGVLSMNALAEDRGPIVLYDFAEASGDQVIDRAGIGKPLNLEIKRLRAVQRQSGSLEIRGPAILRTSGPATKLIDAIRRTGEITIDVWIKPANTHQKGPARIVTVSRNTNLRNVTLGQEGDRFDVRFRSTRASDNGLPSQTAPARSVVPRPTHLVFTRTRDGSQSIFIDGKIKQNQRGDGRPSNWDKQYVLALGNELSSDRPWLGTFYRVAIYDRAMSTNEVEDRFRIGHKNQSVDSMVSNESKAAFFETRIAPLIANHCLECHDASTRKGGLDLSRKTLAFKGGLDGEVLAPGKSSESELWKLVASDEMPHDRPALSDNQKDTLRHWIDNDAVWSLERIDPAIYVYENQDESPWVQRLTIDEYIATVKATIGVDIDTEAREMLPADVRADGFSNTAYNLNVDLGHVEAYASLAEKIVGRLDAAAFARRFSKSRRLTDDDARKLISAMGKWVLRGPLQDHELNLYRGISTSVMAAGGDFDKAVRIVVFAMLQSPRFLYRIERQIDAGTVDNYELASRLSYIIWGTSPDAALMQAADKNQLSGDALAKHVDRMLRDSRAIDRSKQFVTDWLNLGRLDNLRPNAEHFPNWEPGLANQMSEETLSFFVEVAWKQNRPLSELLSAPSTIVAPQLAAYYGLPVTAKSAKKYDLSSVPGRGGILTHGSVLTVGGDEASMVSRGLFVMQNLLRGVVKDPPPCVDTTPVPTRSGLSQRGIAELRMSDTNCAGCHAKFEPLAFGLEKFDGLGRYQELDQHGNQLRDDGQVLIPGTEKPIAYRNSQELMELLAASDRVRETITWKVAQFALGRRLMAGDARSIAAIHKQAQTDGGTYRALMKAIVTSDLVLE